MKAESLRDKARRYRRLARGINDEKTITILEQMACELEARAAAGVLPVLVAKRLAGRKKRL